jgi:hypothetical protein
MAVESDRSGDVLRLNALVDGELGASERAALAARLAADRDLARAHATLAQLKACVLAAAEATPAPPLPVPRARYRLARAAAAVAATAVVGLVVFIVVVDDPGDRKEGLEVPHTIVELAAFPANPVVPDLTAAGLKLAGVAIESPGGVTTVVANYRGPRGCRLVLRVRPVQGTAAHRDGTARKAWTVGNLAYELIAFGMPAERFAVTAAAAEDATRNRFWPPDSRRLRQASLDAPPCVG